jgi:hypothetical protein
VVDSEVPNLVKARGPWAAASDSAPGPPEPLKLVYFKNTPQRAPHFAC